MVTLKLKYEGYCEKIKNIQLEQNSLIRTCTNYLQSGKIGSNKEWFALSKTLNHNLSSWFVYSVFSEAKGTVELAKERNQKSIIFGGRKMWYRFINKLITKEEWDKNRIRALWMVGESVYKGTRYIDFSKASEGIIVFKPSKGIKLELKLVPGALKARFQELSFIQNATQNRQLPVTVQIDKDFIYLSYEPKIEPIKVINSRILAIDSNPNAIGFSVVDGDKILQTGILDLTKLEDSNKVRHEIQDIAKRLVDLAIHYKCAKFTVENLRSFKTQDRGGRAINKLLNQKWVRGELLEKVAKRTKIAGIKLIEVDPRYSSFIGNTRYNFPDPIAASLEIARRGGLENAGRDWVLPKLENSDFSSYRRNGILENSPRTWRNLFRLVKMAKFKYRRSLKDYYFKVFRVRSKTSNVNLIMGFVPA